MKKMILASIFMLGCISFAKENREPAQITENQFLVLTGGCYGGSVPSKFVKEKLTVGMKLISVVKVEESNICSYYLTR